MTKRETHASFARWAWLLLAAALVAIMPAPAVSAPTLEVSQANVTVQTGRTTRLLLSASDMPAGASLRIDADAGIEWRLRRENRSRWTLWVGAQPGLTSDGFLTAELIGSSKQPLASTHVKVTPKPLPPPDSVVQAMLMLDGGGLVEGRRGRAYLVISNRSEQALAVREVVSLGSQGIVVTPEAAPSLILPRETSIRPLTIEVAQGRAPRTGSHLLAVRTKVTTALEPEEVRLAGRAAGPRDWQAEILATKDIELSVPGVSELKGVLQIPTLLLLPGVLAVIAFTAVLDLARPRPLGEDPVSRLSAALSPGLWVVVIMVSAAIGGTYSVAARRDILSGFGTRDVVWLWFMSLILGGIAGWIAYHNEKKKQKADAAPRFAPGMSPSDFLSQLIAEGEPLRRSVRLLGDQLLFDLGPGATRAERWACGGIGVRALGQDQNQTLGTFRDAADDQQQVRAVTELAGRGRLTLRWLPFTSGSVMVAEPRVVSATLFKGVQRQDSILQEEA